MTVTKSKIENIYVDFSGSGITVNWQIGSDRFHVWLRDDGPEDTVYKNSIAKHDEPGHCTTRRLTREGSKVTSQMFDEVMVVVERDGLLAKAEAEDRAKNARFVRANTARYKLSELEQQVLKLFRQGKLNDAGLAKALHLRMVCLNEDIAANTDHGDQQ